MKKRIVLFAACVLLPSCLSGCAAESGSGQTSAQYEESGNYIAGSGIIEDTVTSIIVHAETNNIEFVPSDQGILSIEDELDQASELKEDWQLHYYYDGLTLYVEEYASGVSIAGAPEKTIVIYVPAGNTYAILEGESRTGDVTATGILADQLELETKSGEIRVTDLTAKSMSLEVSSGNITADNVTSSAIEGDSDTGNLDISLASQPYRVELETTTGNVHLTLPEKPGFTLALELGDGIFVDNYGLTEGDNSSGSLDSEDDDSDEPAAIFTAGTGENRYKIETKSGEVNLEIASSLLRE